MSLVVRHLKTLELFGYFGWNVISKDEFLTLSIFHKGLIVRNFTKAEYLLENPALCIL